MISRLSMARESSRLPFANPPEQVDDNIEPPPSRWDVDKPEMDKSLQIHKRKRESTVRLRKMNSVHERLLDGKIKFLHTSFNKTAKQLRKETKHLKEQFKDFEPVVLLPKLDLATPSLVGSRTGSRSEENSSRPGTRESACQSCIFGTQSAQCKHFPCYLPVTYNSFRYRSRPQTYSVVSNYDKLLRRCYDRRPVTSMDVREEAENIPTVEDILRTAPMARASIQEKERGLKELVRELKQKNEKTKPRDWATNYGAPVPRRMLSKPAVPVDINI